MLVQKAQAAGCEVMEDMEVVGVDEEANRPRLKLANGRGLTCDFLVDATGRGAMLARKRGGLVMNPAYGRVGIYNYLSDLPPHDAEDAKYITMYLFEGGWVWLIPLADGRTSVGVVLRDKPESGDAGKSREEAIFWRTVAKMPRLEKRLKAARATEDYRAIADYSYTVREKVGERFVMIGDAAGFLDPIFSSGVHLALSSAERAAAGIVEKMHCGSDAKLIEYSRFMDRGYAVFSAFVHRFYSRDLARNLFFMTNKPAGVHAAITRILAGHVWEADNPVLRMIGVSS
jgi:flavin-dependent dehydrogenase